jgi:hypothetical protein
VRIYAAGYYSAYGTRSVNAQVTMRSRPDFVLESYHYMNEHRAETIKKEGGNIFLDSGAFSMFTKGITVDLQAYADFIKTHGDIIHISSNLDVIGQGNEQGSYDNQKILEGYGVDIKPVHHARDKDGWLQRYLDEGYQHIFLGGMVPETTDYLREWLDHVWEKYLTNPDGTAKVKVHGFGLTVLSLMFRYPWYSLDSTSWVMTSRFGSCYLDLPKAGRSYKVDFSSQSMKRFDDNSWHYDSLKPAEKRVVDERLEELEALRQKDPEVEEWLEKQTGIKQGYNAEALAKMFGWRDHFNIQYFNRQQASGVTKFVREQGGLF